MEGKDTYTSNNFQTRYLYYANKLVPQKYHTIYNNDEYEASTSARLLTIDIIYVFYCQWINSQLADLQNIPVILTLTAVERSSIIH